MSHHVFFAFSTGLAEPLCCPTGTLAGILEHVRGMETTLRITRVQDGDNPPHWGETDYAGIADDVLCNAAADHNRWVVQLYGRMEAWSEKPPVADGETISPEQAAEFWPALQFIAVPAERWTADYYQSRMDVLYDVMRGREVLERITFGVKALTAEQADAVINLFAEFLDRHDIQLAVPRGHDYLARSDTGEYVWCDHCGAIAEQDIEDRVANCRRKDCPIREEYGDEVTP